MEGRRVEGVFLDTAILRNRAYEAYETARILEIRILSSVPQALLASLGDLGSRLRATVRSYDQNRVVLQLENGFEVEAENRLSVMVEPGEELSLVVESKNPLVLRVEGGFYGIKGVRDLLGRALDLGVRLIPQRLEESLRDSGLIYERKVWDFLRGKISFEDLSKDQKFLLLKTLEGVDTDTVEMTLRSARFPEDLRPLVRSLLERLEAGDRLGFFRGLIELESDLERAISFREQRLNLMRETIGSVVRSLVDNLIRTFRSAGMGIQLREEVFSSLRESPRFLDILREAFRSLEEGRLSEFARRLELAGLKIINMEALPREAQRLVRSIGELIRGAEASIRSNLEAENLQDLISRQREISKELEELKEIKGRIEELPKQIKESLKGLETLGMLQSYMIMNQARRFLVPFRFEEGRGVMGFSLRDAYRIFVRLELDGGFLGILMEAPRKENPDFISVLFRTDLEDLAERLSRHEEDLKKELSSLGLEVRRLEILEDREGEFEREMAEEFGGTGTFNLRV